MHTMHTTHRRRRAFTIVEVMIVLVIIGLIGAIVGINLVGAAQEARIRTTKSTLQNIQSALKLYHGSNGSYPVSTGDLSTLIQQNILQLSSDPVDAWNRPIMLYCDGVNYTLQSYGPDGVESDDDLVLTPDHQ